MRHYAKSFLTASVFLVSVGLWSQEVYHFDDTDLLARLSYDSSAPAPESGVRHVCVAVSRDGSYWSVRSLNSGRTQRLQGEMSKEQLRELTALLKSTEFRSISDKGGLMREDFQSFGAEVPRENGTQRLRWLNADGESPFPDSIAAIPTWLQRFEPTHGSPFEHAQYPNVCPSGGLRLLQPSVAANPHP